MFASNFTAAAVYSSRAYFHDFSIPVNLPFRRNPRFCGRENTLEKICKILEPLDLAQRQPNTLGTSERKKVVLHGMGGIGKSQIALEYSHRFRHCYTSIFWIDANELSRTTENACKIVEQLAAHYASKSRSAPDYQAISNILGIPGKIDSSGRIVQTATEQAIEAVHIWAQVEELEKLIPTELVEVEEIGAEAGLELLLKSLGKHEKPLLHSELGEAKEIVIALGELPLALDQAGAYIRYLKIRFSTYRDRLEKDMEASFWRSVEGFGLSPDKASVLTTWKLSFQELHEDARKMLYLCAFLSNDDIPHELFHRGKSAVGWIKAMEEEDRFQDTIGQIFAFSLAKQRDYSDDSFYIHPLVQAWTREHIDSALQLQKVEDTIKLVDSTINLNPDEMSSDDWIFERRIFSHLGASKDNISKYFKGLDNPDVSFASMSIGSAYQNLGYYKEAEALFQIALIEREKSLGKGHPSTLEAVHNIGAVFNRQRALAGKEKALGADHPSTLDTVDNIADILHGQKRYDEALKWHQRTLVGKEKMLGADHPSTLDTVNNIAVIFRSQGRYDQALELSERVLAGKEKALGSDHPSTLDAVDNIARALAGKDKQLGEDHPSTLDTVDNIAVSFRSQGLSDEALKWHQRALRGKNKSLGIEHPSVLVTLNDIADIFDEHFHHDKALVWYRREMRSYEDVFGQGHPATLRILHNMVGVFYALGLEEEARNSEQSLQAKAENSRGKPDPSTPLTANMGDPITSSTRHGYVILNATKYIKVKAMGRGSFGTAWLIESQSNKEKLVCKEILCPREEDRKEFLKSFTQEYSLLEISDHPNIVRFVSFQPPDAIDSTGRVYMEYCEGGDLKNLLSLSRYEKRRSLTEEAKNRFYMKNRWKTILHRDIKPSNVLVSRIHEDQISVKPCDFGIEKFHAADMTGTYIGTQGYIAPEITKKASLWTPKADIYSLGRTIEQLNTQTGFQSIKNLADDCMKKAPKDRPSSLSLLEIAGRRISDNAFKAKRWEKCSFLALISIGRIEVTATED
ncbi:hypothetical protein RUND412_002670 [Rhizina undulata]